MKDRLRNFRRARASSRTRGLSLLETAMVIGVLSLLMVYYVVMTQAEADRINSKITGDRLASVSEAAKGYITAHYKDLLASAPLVGNGAQVIRAGRTDSAANPPAGSLQAEGYLPPSFVDTNGFQQRTALLVRKLADGKTLEAMLTTYGGRDIPDRMLGQITKALGPSGGFMPTDYVDAGDDGMVLGTNGGWKTDAADWGAATTRPSTGTIQMSMMFENGTPLKDYLYRNDIGIPQANRMETNIDLNSQAINNIRKLSGINDSVTGSKTVVIGETGDTNSLRATIDVWADKNVHAADDVTAGKNVDAGNNVTAGKNVKAGNNVTADNNITAANQLAGDTLYVENRDRTGRAAVIQGTTVIEREDYVEGTASTEANLDVKGKLKADKIDVAAIVTDDAGRFGANGRSINGEKLTLGDFMPLMVPQYSYLVRDGDPVPKPTCKGGYNRARIMVYRQIDSVRVHPDIDLTVQTAHLSEGQTAVGGVAVNNANSWVKIATGVIATENTYSWNVQWVGSEAWPSYKRQALAQTYCWYGKQT